VDLNEILQRTWIIYLVEGDQGALASLAAKVPPLEVSLTLTLELRRNKMFPNTRIPGVQVPPKMTVNSTFFREF
jgi:hypothetical protein